MFLPSNITLKFGDSGDFVSELQRRLAMVKCFDEHNVNGFYDGVTVNAVTSFQGMNGLHADGVAGPETLRRLNGVIAGDTSSTTENKEEEEKKQAHANEQVLNYTLAQEPLAANAWGEPELPREEAAPVAPAMDAQHFAPPPIEAAPPLAAPPMSEADRAAMVDLTKPPVSPNPAVDLNSMLSEAERHQQQSQALRADPIPQPQQPQMQPSNAAAALEQFAQRPLDEPQPRPVEPAVPEAAPSLMQRAGRFANTVMQKLSDYFEAKLPPSVMNEVRAAGNIMAAAGLKEAPIPTGPEFSAPEQIPSRGTEQQPVQQR